jgi:hypothetical protein
MCHTKYDMFSITVSNQETPETRSTNLKIKNKEGVVTKFNNNLELCRFAQVLEQ